MRKVTPVIFSIILVAILLLVCAQDLREDKLVQLSPPPATGIEQQVNYIYRPIDNPLSTSPVVIKTAVIPVQFINREAAVSLDNIRDIVANKLNDYYEEVSYGAIYFDVEIATQWYVLPNTIEYYGSGEKDEERKIELIKDALSVADADFDYRYFDSVIIVHAGDNEAVSNDPNDIWSSAVLGDFSTNDGVVSLGVAILAESDPLGVFAHEMGHILGLPDLYDIDGTIEYVGRWDLMAKGSWNGEPLGSMPAHLSAWSKMKLNWIPQDNIVVVKRGEKIIVDLYPIELSVDKPQVIKIVIDSWRYYTVEVRKKIGYDSALPDEGVLIALCNDLKRSGEGIVRVVDAVDFTETLNDAVYSVNMGFYDATNSITIEVLSENPDGSFKIRVVYSAVDLEVSNIWFDPEKPVIGQDVFIFINITNTGNLPSHDFYVHIIIDGQIYAEKFVDILHAGESIVLDLLWQGRGGEHKIEVLVDPENKIAEIDEKNNLLSVSIIVYALLEFRGLPVEAEIYLNGTAYSSEDHRVFKLKVKPGRYIVALQDVVPITENFRWKFIMWSDGNSEKIRVYTFLNNTIIGVTYAPQYLAQVVFKTADNREIGGPLKAELSGPYASKILLTEPVYSDWFYGGVWKIDYVMWQGVDVTPELNSFEIDRAGNYTLKCAIFPLRVITQDLIGVPAPLTPFSIEFPNGTQIFIVSNLNALIEFEYAPKGVYTFSVFFTQQIEEVKEARELVIKTPVSLISLAIIAITIIAVATYVRRRIG